MTEVATIVDIIRLKEQGLSKRATAKRLGISRDTVSKYWDGELTNIKPLMPPPEPSLLYRLSAIS